MSRHPGALGSSLALLAILGSSLAACTGPRESGGAPVPDHADTVAGFVPLLWDEDSARLFMRVPPPEQEVLHMVSLPGGLGSNDVGLDRGQIGSRELVRFRPIGKRILMVAPNLDWRSSAVTEVERAGVRDSFAESVLWGFDPAPRERVPADEDGDKREGTWVDATEFFLRDAHGIAARLANSGQGEFRLDESRSALLAEDLRGFTDNSVVEALLTFTSSRPGAEVRSTAASAESVTLRLRHTWVRLDALEHGAAEGGGSYRARPFDPRSGFQALGWKDLSAPVDESMRRDVLVRHHLTHDHPIHYWVDSAAPEPVRTALLEGARYWVPVFEKAGFPGGFQVELLPPGADPLDLAYNVIQWVHRSTRGWSYGDAVADPRTGEILKGHVSLGALRVRQDVLLAEGLLSPYGDGEGDARTLEVALARIRQLAAHEIGHTLGLAHNFAASTDGRASVMDYPAPWVQVGEDGELDFSEAYREGCGEWDELAIRFGYGDFGETLEEEAVGLRETLDAMRREGLHYLSDVDARGAGRAHPLANLWDNGSDPLEALGETYRVRALALERFSESALRAGRPLAELERVLVPVYLHHRYQLEAAVRAVGGVEYEYRMVGDSDASPALRPVPSQRQRAALRSVLASLEPDFLRLPEGLGALLPPPPPAYSRDRESFDAGAHLFDSLSPARASIAITLDFLLAPERLSRLAADPVPTEPGGERPLQLEELLGRLLEGERFGPTHQNPLGFVVQDAILTRLIETARARNGDPRVKSTIWSKLRELVIQPPRAIDPWHLDLLKRFIEAPAELGPLAPAARIPPGSPIGCGFGG